LHDSSRIPAAAEAQFTPLRTLSAVEKVIARAGKEGRPNNSPTKSTREEAIFHVYGSV
jgi:hypothetical protein